MPRTIAATPTTALTVNFHAEQRISAARAWSWASSRSSDDSSGSGRSAPYPVARMVSTSRSGDVTPGS